MSVQFELGDFERVLAWIGAADGRRAYVSEHEGQMLVFVIVEFRSSGGRRPKGSPKFAWAVPLHEAVFDARAMERLQVQS